MSLKQNHFSHLAIRLILAMTILAGMFAWLPQPAQAAGVEAQALGTIRWGAKLVDHTLVINGSGFAASRIYIVRAKYRSDEPYTRLGKVRSNKQGKINIVMDLPAAWYSVPNLRVCLKDSTNSKSYCVIAKR